MRQRVRLLDARLVLLAHFHLARLHRPLHGKRGGGGPVAPPFRPDADDAALLSQDLVGRVVQGIILQSAWMGGERAGRENGRTRGLGGGEEQFDFAFEQKRSLREPRSGAQ